MKTKVCCILALLLASAAAPMRAQITVVSPADADQGTVCDQERLRVAYQTTFVEDTVRTDAKPRTDLMILEIGKSVSQFYSYNSFVADSIFSEDTRKGASSAVINEHLKNFSHGAISWKIYKNYAGKGTTTLLDGLGLERYRCDEKEPLPKWTLGTDTATVMGYHCRQATCQYKGRQWSAWFTTEIAISEGPWKLRGLPGLILKAEDAQHHYRFEATGLVQNRGEKEIRFKGVKHEPISRKELNRLYTRYYADPVSYITNNPSVTVKITDENGNTVANPKAVPYNPIER